MLCNDSSKTYFRHLTVRMNGLYYAPIISKYKSQLFVSAIKILQYIYEYMPIDFNSALGCRKWTHMFQFVEIEMSIQDLCYEYKQSISTTCSAFMCFHEAYIS